MSASKVDIVSNLTFLSMTGPTLSNADAKAMRAHTTRANFRRRRLRLVREYADEKECAARIESQQAEGPDQITDHNQAVDIQLTVFSHPGLDQRLNRKDAFLVDHLTRAMQKLHLVTDIPVSDTASAVMQSDWARFLPDPTIIDVSLYWARHVYAARLQHQAGQFIVDAYKGRAIRSVRERLNDGSDSLSDSLIAAILILTVLDQTLGNIDAWKIHLSGLLQIIGVRSRNSKNPPTHWILQAIPRTIMQGLLLFTRHDVTSLTTIEKFGVFNTMFSAPAKKAAHLILANVEQVAALHDTYVRNEKLLPSEQLRLRRVIKSLDKAIQVNNTAYPREAFLTAKALSIKIFLETVLRHTTNTNPDPSNTPVQLMEILQKPEQQLCSSLALCSSLEFVFWQTMMGAIAAPDAQTEPFYMSRLRRITIALALTSWHDALVILRRFFWIPSIFSAPGYRIMSEILSPQDHSNI